MVLHITGLQLEIKEGGKNKLATKTETNLDTLKINYLSEPLYQEALKNGQINENELYMTPYEDVDISVNWNDVTNKPLTFPPSSYTHNDKADVSVLNAHTGNTTNHITSSERTNWNNASNHANSSHAPVNAEQNQNAFSYVCVNGYTISADTKMDTLNLEAGTGITITPNTTYDRITISADSMNCTLEDLGVTATAAELNFCDGVTSNIQTQLNGKAPSGHSHSASQITGLPTIEAITDSEIDSLRYL